MTENSKEKTNAQGFFWSDGVPKDVASFSHIILIHFFFYKQQVYKHASLGFLEKLSTSLSTPSASVCPQATNFFLIFKGNAKKIQKK